MKDPSLANGIERDARTLSSTEWVQIAVELCAYMRDFRRRYIEIVRANQIGSEMYVLYIDKQQAADDEIRGLRYDVSEGNYDGKYPGSIDHFALDLILIKMLESGSDHPAKSGEIV